MCSYKSDIYKLRCELYHHDQTKIVAFDVEHIMLVSNRIYRIESLANIGKIIPFALLDFLNPLFESGLRFGMGFII